MNRLPFYLQGLGVLSALVFLARAVFSDATRPTWPDILLLVLAFVLVIASVLVAGASAVHV